ncbi:MAG: glycosyltransferase family 4 protein [Sulfurovum sp.]|nr:glycosyltransferase family 4 protein [Sulfurovum sp.]
MNILHLTQTDIKSDSRILKEMNSIATLNSTYEVSGIGVILNRGEKHTNNKDNLDIYSIILKSREWRFLPRVIRHTCSLVELTFKMFYKAKKLQPKVIHCHDTLVLPLGVMVKAFTGAKLIYDAHELESDRNGLTKILGKLTLFAEKALWRYVDALIVVSPSIEKWYMENIGDKYSEIVLNSPVLEKEESSKESSYLREYFSIPKESKIFLYVGGLVHGRGIELLTDAFRVSDIKSSLVFLGYGTLSDELKEIASSSSNIYVHDAVPHEEVVPVAKSADIGLCLIQNVSLSDYYCLPNKLFEYCFAEIPVLASDFPDISATVKKYNLGKCTELNSASIYEAIKEFENMEVLENIDINKLYELSWEAQEDKLIKLYEQIIKVQG